MNIANVQRLQQLGHAQMRYYLLRNLPKVGADKKKVNRFADMYLNSRPPRNHHPRKSPRSDDNESDGLRLPKPVVLPPQDPAAQERAKFQQYTQLREKLKGAANQHQKQKPSKQARNKKSSPSKAARDPIKISIPTFVTVSNLATMMGIPLAELMTRLEMFGYEKMTHLYILNKEDASLIASEFGFEVTMSNDAGMDLFPAAQVTEKLKPRPPVVTIMGHVDHGKTTILDYLRRSSVVASEFGGITQHIGAFSVVTPISKKNITFLDTPGHAAFLSMRERGANVTDIVILVVAADDSVMPQTIEAIKHAKKAGVPMVVAINKSDKKDANFDKVLADLARYEVDIEDYGGDTQTVRVSGKTGMNMDKLEEAVITLSELNDFVAEPVGVPAEGWVIESEVQQGLGNVLTMLIKRGTVKPGTFLVAGQTYCKVRGMRDENGKPVKQAGPSMPVQVWGWKELPLAGEQALEAKTEQICRKVIRNREDRQRQIQAAKDIETINEKRQEEVDEMRRQEKINELKLAGLDVDEFIENAGPKTEVVKYMIKADVFGSAEAIKESIDGLGNDEVKSLVISHDAGAPTESDLDTASAVGASILCFNLKVPKNIHTKADALGVSITEHNVIYRLIEGVTSELTSKLKPHIEIKVVGEVDLKDIFNITGKNKSVFKIGGCKVVSGTLKRGLKVRVLRKGQEIFSGKLSSLKQVKDDIAEVKRGAECGLSFEGWDKFEPGDKVEAFEEVEIPRYL